MELASNISNPSQNNQYPNSITTLAKQALYDNLDNNEILALAIDSVIHTNKLDGWRDGGIKEKKLRIAINEVLNDAEKTSELMKIIKAQSEY
jgi:type I restriction enzyme R subunit